jgi:hypothetical protein
MVPKDNCIHLTPSTLRSTSNPKRCSAYIVNLVRVFKFEMKFSAGGHVQTNNRTPRPQPHTPRIHTIRCKSEHSQRTSCLTLVFSFVFASRAQLYLRGWFARCGVRAVAT